MRAQTNETFITESVCRFSVQVTKEMARTLSRCPGPMQAHKSKSEKEQALHFGCTNLEDLEDCVAVFARTPREAQTVADCIKVWAVNEG